ncbi:MAG: DsbA family protein [Pseudomonadota bacterium]
METKIIRSALLGVCLATGGAAQAVADDAFGDRVREYILNNPEVIVEALTLLAEKERKAAVAAKIADFPGLFSGPPSLGIGHPEAPIRVVEFFDFKCVPCKAIHPQLEAFVASSPEVRIEQRHLPILTPGSERAARFALAVQALAGDDAYTEAVDRIWAITGPLNSASFERVAGAMGLDYARIEPEMESDAITARIDYNRDAAIELGILGTPAFLTPTSVTFGETNVSALGEIWLSR